MADFAASSSPRSRGSSTSKGRARAASSDDVRRPARAAVEAEPESATVQEADDVLQLPPIDPRQGTLLGFELPAEALALIAEEQAPPVAELLAPAQPTRGARGKPAESEVADDAREQAAVVEKEVAPQVPAESIASIPSTKTTARSKRTVASEPAAVDRAAPEPVLIPDAAQAQPAPAATGSENGALAGAREPGLLSPGAALASVRQQAARRPAQTARPSGTPASIEASAPPVPPTPGFAVSSAAVAVPEAPIAPAAQHADAAAQTFDMARPAELAETVASLQEALAQERLAAQERWRRTRHWLGLALGGLVLLFAISVAQTVALISFSHRAQADQQKTQSALNEQQAALAGLASSTSALAALIPAPAPTPAASAADASTPRPARHVRLAHARRLKEKADKVEKADKADKTKAAAR